MKIYCGIDLHSNNSVVALTDENDQVVYQRRLRNELELILNEIEPFKESIQGIVVESTYNWYWLVDGLIEAGHTVHLANIAAMQQYSGLKYTDDNHDARWLAHMLRIGVLAEGYIYPKEDRAIRDLLRKRSQMVKQKVTQMLSISGLFARNCGNSISANNIRKLTADEVDRIFPDINLASAMKSNLAVMRCLEEQIQSLEQQVELWSSLVYEHFLIKQHPVEDLLLYHPQILHL
jgi:transposase